ncbi:dynactin 2 [Schistosoma bovis]|uniref:Dynactin 2 n=1 Tax=Schistosoma bovis TaxID=6184 RepID=A0A430QBL4_SCHBO|nr:dynactin 2 [Schistosoma bovis]
MSLDPKYADLPWIAHGQPDVYEAGELPEADQMMKETVEDTMSAREIEVVKLSVSEAHRRFAGCKVDSSNVDFSDSISGNGKIGYAIEMDQYDFVADIDRRIHRIEALIGQPDPNKLTALTADTTTHGLLEACSRLSARSSLFQQGYLDMIEARLASLQGKLQAVTEKREAIADYDMQNKIAELYELVKKWNDVAESLPVIVERLSTLKSLHEEASQFSQSLCTIESSQKNVEGSLSSYTKLLEEVASSYISFALFQVQNNVIKNMEVIKDNFTTIESHFPISSK